MGLGCYKVWLSGIGFIVVTGLVGLVIGYCLGWVASWVMILIKRKGNI